MKIIVHFGSGKTGSTSLQHSLAAKRKLLAKHGIYYPDTFYPNEAHHLLQTLFKPSNHVLPFLADHYGGFKEAQKKAYSAWKSIVRNAKKNKPDVLLLSSEMFFKPTNYEMQQVFFDLLSELSDDIAPVLYVREPASFYLAKIQQRSRESGFVASPDGQTVKDTIEGIEAAFKTRMKIRAFEKSQLESGDVVQDFVSTYLAENISAEKIPTLIKNESISAEAMVIASSFRRINLPDKDMIPQPDSWRVLTEINRIESNLLPKKRPVLKPEIASQIQRASTDFLWLKEERGIEFGTLDYSKIDGQGIEPTDLSVDMSDIIHIDWARHDLLLYKYLQHELRRGAESSIRIVGIDFRLSNLALNFHRLKQVMRKLGSR